jgi:hypothetical protein
MAGESEGSKGFIEMETEEMEIKCTLYFLLTMCKVVNNEGFWGFEGRDEIRVRCVRARLHISDTVDLFATYV